MILHVYAAVLWESIDTMSMSHVYANLNRYVVRDKFLCSSDKENVRLKPYRLTQQLEDGLG